MKANKELVISVYDRDYSWIKEINPQIKITPYRKGESQNIKNKEIYLEKNVGRDVHTFFYHIYENYEYLADYTFFVQDHPFDHWENLIQVINEESIPISDVCTLKNGGYFGFHNNNMGTAWNLDQIISFERGGVLFCNSDGTPHVDPSICKLDLDNNWYNIFYCPHQSKYEFMPGGHFAITKDQIKIRSREFYKSVIDYLEDKFLAPWIIERFEIYIFDEKYKTKL